MSDNKKHKDVNNLLRGLFSENTKLQNFELIELFEQRLADLSITKNQACIILDLEHKTLDPVLDGVAKKIDFLTILKLKLSKSCYISTRIINGYSSKFCLIIK